MSVDEAMTVKEVKESLLKLMKESETLSEENDARSVEITRLKDQRQELEVEAVSMAKRSEVLEKEALTTTDDLEVVLGQVDHLAKVADDNERWRKEYEKKQMDSDERVDEMTSIVKAAYASTESASAKYDEAFEKLHQTTENISELEHKIDAARKRIDQREKEVKEKVAIYKELQCKSEQRQEKELKKEEYINFLRKQVEEAELRADKAEAEVAQKQADISRLKNKLKVENDSVGTLKKDMTSMHAEFKKL